jgi:ADP-heptose:LPS heptosyltransferase
VATPMNVHIRIWMALIKQTNHFVGCDSVGQHLAYAFDKTATVVIGSTYPINTSFPDAENIDIIDLGSEDRVYSPIRITSDEFSDRLNEGIMAMDDQTEDKVVKSVEKMLKQSKNKQ